MARARQQKNQRKSRQSSSPRKGTPQPRRRQTRRRGDQSRLSTKLPASAVFIHNVDAAVRPILAASATLSDFLARVSVLTNEERLLLVEQAIVLLDGFYVHLPLKRAMHAVDPLQRLRLLRKRLNDVRSDARFHAEMTQIFTSVRDLHTNYLLPEPFSRAVASLPFRVEACVENGKRIYIVGGVATGFEHPTFKPGVHIRYWNGAPMDRAVDNAADRHAGSNLEARHARGLAGMTQRPLIIAPAPDEEWVIIGYKALDGSDQEIRLDWLVTGLPSDASGVALGEATAPAGLGLDIETEFVQQARRILFAPQTQSESNRIKAAGANPLSAVSGTESIMPGVFSAREVITSSGTFGYIRIWTFGVNDVEAFVNEFVRLAELLPQNGLIVDVRDNGGGLINAGEQLLQILTPRTIEPERLQFINTALTLRLCELHAPSTVLDDFDLSPWLPSIRRAVETGATFSASFPITAAEKCNVIGQRYHGPVVLITSARCYSTTDIFAAGFQDHGIGPILGVDGNTGAGGANVWAHDLFRLLFGRPDQADTPLPDSPFKPLPKGARMRVAIRRTLRVGRQAGTELEDLGVVPDHRHAMSRNDILHGNADLIEKAASLLAGMPVFRLSATTKTKPGDKLAVEASCMNIDRLDFYLDGRPQRSEPVDMQTNQISVELVRKGASVLLLEGYRREELVARRQVAL